MRSQKGQILLIIVMLLATALTVALTVIFRSTTETQITKLEEENQKALAAAEAGIEAALRQGTIANIGSLPGLSGFTGSANIDTTTSNQFITPLLQKDEQYTFYLSTYDPQTKTFTGGSTAQAINICFGSSSSRPAIEIALIKSNGAVNRYAINPSSASIIQNGLTASSPTSCPSGETFTDQYTIASSDIGNDSRLLIVRIISPSASTKIGFRGASNLPLQGKTITSEATSSTGVKKTVQLFQSYPQIPAEFFVTSF